MSTFDHGALDWGVVRRGAGYSLTWVVPATILNLVAAANDVGSLVFLTFLAILLGFAFGGYAAAREPLDTPLQHAAAAAFLAFVVVQGVLLVVAVVRGSDINPVGIAFTGFLSACTGILGGLLAVRGVRPSQRRA